MRGVVVAAMFGCWKKAKGAATEFWVAVRDETGSKPDCPDRKLSRFLLTTNVQRSMTERKIVGQREMYVKCIHAWNAWRRKESTSLNYYANAKVPAFQ